MAYSVNYVTLVGNLGADPEIKEFDNGGMIANLRVATTETWKDRESGEKREETQWHNVVIKLKHSANFAKNYAVKGDTVHVMGKLVNRKWTDKDGNDRYVTEVVVAAPGHDFQIARSKSPGGQSAQASGSDDGSDGSQTSNDSGTGSDAADFDDEIPF